MSGWRCLRKRLTVSTLDSRLNLKKVKEVNINNKSKKVVLKVANQQTFNYHATILTQSRVFLKFIENSLKCFMGLNYCILILANTSFHNTGVCFIIEMVLLASPIVGLNNTIALYLTPMSLSFESRG